MKFGSSRSLCIAFNADIQINVFLLFWLGKLSQRVWKWNLYMYVCTKIYNNKLENKNS